MRGQLVRRELGEQHPSERVRVGGQAVARTQVELDRAVGLHPLDEQHVGIGQDPQGRAHAQLAREPAQVGAHGTGQPQGAEIAVSQFDAAGASENWRSFCCMYPSSTSVSRMRRDAGRVTPSSSAADWIVTLRISSLKASMSWSPLASASRNSRFPSGSAATGGAFFFCIGLIRKCVACES